MNRNFLIAMTLALYLMGCSSKTTSIRSSGSTDTFLPIPKNSVNKSELIYDRQHSIWTLNNQTYSGYAVSYHQDGTLKEKFGVLNGRKQNLAIRWYPDGQYKSFTYYHKGKTHGDKKAWAPDSSHTLLSHLKYVAGKLHGEQKKWYPSGELFKKLNMNMGKEEGLQQGFRKNGVLFANYEAKNGRVFGLKKAKLCFGLEDENIQLRGE